MERTDDTSGARARLRERLAEQLQRSDRGLRVLYRPGDPRRDRMVTRETDIVIDGYPRSANTFAVVAFRVAQQPREVRIAHHIHSLGQIRGAVRYDVPVIVLLRQPMAAVSSWLVRRPDLDPDLALSHYSALYSGVARVRDKVVVAPFEEVTGHYADVIWRVNRRFGTDFRPYENSPERDREIFARIDNANRRVESGRSAMLARPSDRRSAAQNDARRAISGRPGLVAATRIYEELRTAAP